MIDYRQRGFDHPAFALDPIPTVAEYLNNYRQLNEDWYASFAYPLEGGGWGARPSSFVRRGAPDPNAQPSQVDPDPAALPPILQEGPPEDTSIMPGDRPFGAIVRDPASLTRGEIMAEAAHLSGLGGRIGQAASMIAPPVISAIMGAMSRANVADHLDDLFSEGLGRGLGSVEAQNLAGMSGGDGPGSIPDLYALVTDSGSDSGGQTADQADISGPSQDTYQGGEVGAGGWAGPGGL